MSEKRWCPACRTTRTYERKPPTFCPAHQTTRLREVFGDDNDQPKDPWSLSFLDKRFLKSLRIASEA